MQNNQNNLVENISRGVNEKAAAQYIGMSVSFLQKDRMNGVLANRTKGPRYLKVGKRVIYLRDELDQWLNSYIGDKNG